MAVKLKKARLSERWKNNAGKYIAQTVQYPTVETEDLAQQVALNTGYPKAMVQMVLNNCLDSAYTFLSIGHPVRLGHIGVVRVNASSVPAEKKEDVEVTLIPGFRCSPELKQLVKDLPHTFVSEKNEDEVDDTGDDQVDTDNGQQTDTTPTTPGNDGLNDD